MLAFRGSFDTYAGLFPRDEGKSYGRGVDELQILMLEASDRFTIKSIIKKWRIESIVVGWTVLRQL